MAALNTLLFFLSPLRHFYHLGTLIKDIEVLTVPIFFMYFIYKELKVLNCSQLRKEIKGVRIGYFIYLDWSLYSLYREKCRLLRRTSGYNCGNGGFSVRYNEWRPRLRPRTYHSYVTTLSMSSVAHHYRDHGDSFSFGKKN